MKGYNDFMPYGNSEEVDCCVCGESFTHYKKLSEHIKKIHKITPVDYYVVFLNNNVRPSCLVCGGETRYVSLSSGFKKYCAADAASASGKLGGKLKETWNRGKTKETDDRVLALSKRVSGSGNPFFGKTHSDATKKRNADAHRLRFEEVLKRVSESSPNAEVVSDWRSYDTQDSLLRVACKECRTEDEVSFFNLKRCWRCKKCSPLGSRQQLEIADYVRSLGFTVHDSVRDVINPLEIDVWVPERNLAIEYHGLYWHSGGREETFDKGRHRRKYEMCRDRGIKLLQVFSDEWIFKRDICKSIIRNALGLNELKLNARDCRVVDISTEEAKAFLEKTHISGYTRSKRKFGLIHREMGLVGVATTRTPIQTKWGHLNELARMSFSSGVTVRGGASKLLARVKLQSLSDNFEGLLSYADLRFGSGRVYEKCGLTPVGESSINYWYTDGHQRLDRFAFRAQKGKSEAEVARDAGVRQVWGPGNGVFIWRPSDDEN